MSRADSGVDAKSRLPWQTSHSEHAAAIGVVKLSAIALSIKPGGSAREIDVAGGLVTHGAGVSPLELHGAVESLQIADGFAAAGGGFERI